MILPIFPGAVRKNDALFMYGASKLATSIFVYEQSGIEVVHGPSCVAENEIFLDRCRSENVPVYERRSGGGTVVLSPGMVITVITGARSRKEFAIDIFHMIHGEMIRVLNYNGIKGVVELGISDLAIDGKKIMGSSLYLGSNPLRYYYQSSLLVSSELYLMDQFLKHPPREPDYRGGRGHGEFCTTLCNEDIKSNVTEICQMFSKQITLP